MMDDMEDRRRSDLAIVALTQKLNDFIERYDRDCGANNERWRVAETELKAQGVILRDISPAYMTGKWIVGLIMLGSISIAVKEFWAHCTWR